MRNLFYICILLFILLFSSCIAIPGYIDDNGNITAPYSEEIIVEAVSGTLIIIPTETSKGPQNINPAKNDLSQRAASASPDSYRYRLSDSSWPSGLIISSR